MTIYKPQLADAPREWHRQMFLLAKAAKRVTDIHHGLKYPDSGIAIDLEPTEENMQTAIQCLNRTIMETDVYMAGYVQGRKEV